MSLPVGPHPPPLVRPPPGAGLESPAPKLALATGVVSAVSVSHGVSVLRRRIPVKRNRQGTASLPASPQGQPRPYEDADPSAQRRDPRKQWAPHPIPFTATDKGKT